MPVLVRAMSLVVEQLSSAEFPAEVALLPVEVEVPLLAAVLTAVRPAGSLPMRIGAIILMIHPVAQMILRTETSG